MQEQGNIIHHYKTFKVCPPCADADCLGRDECRKDSLRVKRYVSLADFKDRAIWFGRGAVDAVKRGDETYAFMYAREAARSAFRWLLQFPQRDWTPLDRAGNR